MASTGSPGGNIDIQSFFKTVGSTLQPPVTLASSSFPPPPPSAPPMPAKPDYSMGHPFPPGYPAYGHPPRDPQTMHSGQYSGHGASHGLPFPGNSLLTAQRGSGFSQGAHLMSLLAPQATAQPSPGVLPSAPSPSAASGPQLQSDLSRPSPPPRSLAEILGNGVPPPAPAPAMPSAPVVQARSSAPSVPAASSRTSTRPPTSKSSRDVSKGRLLAGPRIVYDIDVRQPGEEQPQLEVAPITVYSSEFVLAPGRQIAVNRRYICYALRTAAIRILNMNTALRALLRGHSQRVTDMAFFGEDVHLLATASADGRVLARQLSEEVGEDGKLHIHEHLLFALQLQGPWVSQPVSPQLSWHPELQDTLVVACQQLVFFISANKLNREGGVSSIEAPLICSTDCTPAGVLVLAEHQGPITSLMKWPISVMYLPTPSKDGTVRIWDANTFTCTNTLVPHDRQPVYSASFLLPPGNAFASPVLLTGGMVNQEIKLWAKESEDASAEWHCIQTLELQASSSQNAESNVAFFNQISIVQEAGLILLANTKKQAIYAVHVHFGSTAAETRMDYIAEFAVTMPILSFTALMEPGAESPGRVQVYCVQTSAIQLYSLDVAACLPPREEQPRDSTSAEVGSAPDSLESSQTASEPTPSEVPPAVAALAKAAVSSGFGSPVETGRSLRSKPSHTTEDVSEAFVSGSTDVATVSEVTSVVEEVTGVTTGDAGEVTGDVLEVEETKLVVSSDEGLLSSTETTLSVQTEALASPAALESIPSAPPLSSTPPSDGQQQEEAASKPSVSSESLQVDGSQPAPASSNLMTLLTPAHLMSMVHSSQGEPSSVTTSPSQEPKVDIKLDDKNVQPVSETTALGLASTAGLANTSLPAEVTVPAESSSGEPEASQIQSSAVSIGREAQAEASSVAGPSMEPTPSPVLQPNQDAEPAVAPVDLRDTMPGTDSRVADVGSTAGTAPPLVPPGVVPTSAVTTPGTTKGRKNKNKATASAAATASSPQPSATTGGLNLNLGSPALASREVDLGSSLAPQTSGGISSGGNMASMQDGLNQLLSMQRDQGNKLAMLVAIPVAKEGKRIEAALGTRLEKALKAHADAQWARLQEDAARREKTERERMQQTAAAVVAGLAKELQPAMERTVKKEVAQLAPQVVRLVSPALETSISTISADVLQKLGPQVESSIATQVEAAVGRHVTAQFQSTVRSSMQEALKACFQSAVIPAFESACRGMFEQMDVTLQRGLGEHSGAVQQQLVASHTTLATSLQETMASASAITVQLGEELAEGQRKLVALAEKAAASGAAAGQAAASSGTKSNGLPERVLSVQHVEEALDPTRELTRLLGEHKLEEAFTRALSISDIAIVSWLCMQVDPATVFASGSIPLSQGVLLSLVQQLGCDLGRDLERKLHWLRNAVLALDPTHPQLAPHMRPILQQLYQNLHRQLPHSSDSVASEMRLVIHVVNSLLTSCK